MFAASSLGDDPRFTEAAATLGRELVARGLGLVYGGASVGLMGVVADAVLRAGGQVTGVIPDFMVHKEIAHRGLTELLVVDSMHQRKDTMARRADGFIALPGGFGTVEELFEVLTWGQLGLHAKPCGLLNVGRYWDPLLGFLDGAVARQLLRPAHRAMLLVEEKPDALLDRFATFTRPATSKWFDAELT